MEDRIDLIDIGMQGLIRQGRFADAAELARTAQPLLDRDDSAGKGWRITVNAAAALVCEGDDDGALRFVERAVEDAREAPAILARSLGALAHLQARTGRPAEAKATLAEQRRVVERLAAPEFAVAAAADAGLGALALGDPVEAAACLARPSTAVSSPGAPRPRWREPRPWRWRESQRPPSRSCARRWRNRRPPPTRPGRCCRASASSRPSSPWHETTPPKRSGGSTRRARPGTGCCHGSGALTSEGYLANLLDLGRPPVLGLVEPQRELDRIQALRDGLATRPGSPVEVA